MNSLTTTPTLSTQLTTDRVTLEQCDDMFVKGVLLIKDAVLGYARHGLTGTEIGKRVRALGAKLSDSQARRYIQQFKAHGLLEEKPPSQHPKAVQARRLRENAANTHIARMQQPDPEPPTSETTKHQLTTSYEHRNSSAIQPVSTLLRTVDAGLVPLVETTVVEDGTCIPMVTTYEQQSGTNDYNEVLRITDKLCEIFERNAFKPTITPEQWSSIWGGLRGLVETAEVQSRYTTRYFET